MSDQGDYRPPPGEGQGPQDRYYQRYRDSTGSFDQPPKGGHTLRWVLIGVGAFLLVGVLVVVGLFAGFGGSSSSAQSSSPTSTPSSTPSSTTSPRGSLQVRPVVPGWQAVGGVVNDDLSIYGAYDVPSNWKVKQDDAYYFLNGDKNAIGREVTNWGYAAPPGACAGHPNNTVAYASFVNIGKRDPVDAVQGVLTDFSNAAAINKDKKTYARRGTVTTTNGTVAGGSVPAVQGTITSTLGTLNADCGTGRPISFYAAAFSTNGHSVMALIGVESWPGVTSPDRATIQKVLSSLRPAGG